VASFSFGAGNAGKLLRIPLYAAGRLATAVIPRSADLWVFGSAAGLADGAWQLWQHAQAHGERAVWLTGGPRDAADAAARGIRWAPRSSWRGFWLTARAAVTVVTHGFGDVNRYAATGGTIVQLWHGIPLKRIGLDSSVTTRSPIPVARSAIERLLASLYRGTQRRIRVLPAASELVRGRLESAFGLPGDRVPVTGEPRVDVLSRGTPEDRRGAARRELAELVGEVAEATRFVLYAPTWRDGAPDPAIPTVGQWHTLVRILDETDAVLLIRSHPLGDGVYHPPAATPRVRILGSDLVSDVTGLLPAMHAMITDYSSLVYDAALVPVPTVFLAPDLAVYRAERGFYGTYEEVAGPDPATDWADAAAQLHAVLTDDDERGRRSRLARRLSARVHAHTDGHNTARVYRAILSARERQS